MRFFYTLICSLCVWLSVWGKTDTADTLRIVAVGDIMLGSAYPEANLLPKDDAKYSFEAIRKQLQSADLSFGNLEGVLLDEGETSKCVKSKVNCYAFRMPERYASILANAGFDILSVANNHSGDFGEAGRVQTAKALSNVGIAFAGFDSHPYTLYVKNGIKYGFCAFAPNEGCVSLLDIQAAQQLVSQVKKLADIVIVSFHGGGEGANYQHITRKNEYFYGQDRGNVYRFAHAVIDAGADLVLGNGPHVVRAAELYKNRLIAYSLGNFCTYGSFCLDGPNGAAPLLEIDLNEHGEFLAAKINSLKQLKDQHPQTDETHAAFNYLKSLTQTDFPRSGLVFRDNEQLLPAKADYVINAD